MQRSKHGAAKDISYCRNGEKHGDIHYTFTRLTKLKRRAVPFYPVLLFILAMEILLDVFTGFFNYK